VAVVEMRTRRETARLPTRTRLGHRHPITRSCTVCIRAACATTCRRQGIQAGWPPEAVAEHSLPGMWSSTCRPARTRTSVVWYGRWAAHPGTRIGLCLKYCQHSKYTQTREKFVSLRSTLVQDVIFIIYCTSL